MTACNNCRSWGPLLTAVNPDNSCRSWWQLVTAVKAVNSVWQLSKMSAACDSCQSCRQLVRWGPCLSSHWQTQKLTTLLKPIWSVVLDFSKLFHGFFLLSNMLCICHNWYVCFSPFAEPNQARVWPSLKQSTPGTVVPLVMFTSTLLTLGQPKNGQSWTRNGQTWQACQRSKWHRRFQNGQPNCF